MVGRAGIFAWRLGRYFTDWPDAPPLSVDEQQITTGHAEELAGCGRNGNRLMNKLAAQGLAEPLSRGRWQLTFDFALRSGRLETSHTERLQMNRESVIRDRRRNEEKFRQRTQPTFGLRPSRDPQTGAITWARRIRTVSDPAVPTQTRPF